MLCPACQIDNRDDARYCRACGTAIALACPTCGTPHDAGQAFCDQCGTGLTGSQHRATPAGPELRVASVLFVDLVGYTPLSEVRDVEDVRDLLSGYFDLTRTIVGHYGGTVEKFIGDAVMAVWGVPVARGDDAERAVRAALELVDGVARFGETGGAPLQARAGVATGQVAALETPGEGLVIGDRVNTAARVQVTAEPGTVLVDDTTRQAASAAIAFDEIGERSVKGKAMPIRLHRAVRVIGGSAGVRLRTGVEPPFVGRAGELRLVKDLFHSTIDRRVARLVAVTGPAGVGKTRLGTEFSNYVDGLAIEVHWHFGRCLGFGEGVAYSALADMVRQRLGVTEEMSRSAAATQVESSLLTWFDDPGERAQIGEAIGALLGIADPGLAREELFAAWRVFFERLAERDPVVLMLEDLHWADEGLLDFLEHLLDWSGDHPIFICAFGRPEIDDRRRDWPTEVASATRLRLEPLTAREIGELLDGAISGLPVQLRERIVAHASGMPLYAVETVRALEDRGALSSGEPGRAVASDVEQLEVPPSLHSLLSARLDALSPAERELVRAMAVFGARFPRSAATALTGLEDDRIDELLALLVGRQILSIATDPLSPERGRYAFSQSMLRAVAYEMIGRRDRKPLHLASAEYLRSGSPGQADDAAEVIAAHLLGAFRAAAGDPDEDELRSDAIAALRRAAQRAATVGALESAERSLRAAVELATAAAERAQLTEEAARIAASAGNYESALGLFEAAAKAHLAAGRDRDAARLAGPIGHARGRLGDYAGSVEPMRAAIDVLGGDAANPDVAVLRCDLGRALLFTGHAQEAGELIDQSLAASEALGLHELTCRALDLKAIHMEYLGRFVEAGALHEAAFETGERHRVARRHVALTNAAVLRVAQDMPDAIDACEAALAAARRAGDRSGESLAIGNLMSAQLYAGLWAAAAELGRGVIIDDPERPDVEYIHLQLGLLQVHRGELEDARASLRAMGSLEVSDDVEARHGFATLAGLLALGADDARESMELLSSTAQEAFESQGASSENVRLAWPGAVDAALALGEREAAQRLIEMLAARPEGLIAPILRSELDRALGRLAQEDGDGRRAEEHLTAAARAAARLEYPFWAARANCDLASSMLRDGRASEAAVILEGATETLAELGAEPELTRARRLLGRAIPP